MPLCHINDIGRRHHQTEPGELRTPQKSFEGPMKTIASIWLGAVPLEQWVGLTINRFGSFVQHSTMYSKGVIGRLLCPLPAALRDGRGGLIYGIRETSLLTGIG
jgi:hypothetical protein